MIAASQYNLIIAIVNRGYSDQVMKAAQQGGATGGTILLARGAGNHEVEKFLGFTIQPEKEIVLILAQRDTKQDIMRAVCKQCGSCTPAKGMSFALPVEDTFGLPVSILERMQGTEDAPRKTGS